MIARERSSRSTLTSDDHEPFLVLLSTILEPMPPQLRIQWTMRQLPRTYSLLAVGQRWAVLSDF